MKIPRLSIVVLSWACTPAAAPPPPAAPSPFERLDQMDPRQALPLLPMMAHHQKENMRGHLVAVQQIVAAMVNDDYPAVVAAAQKIGYSDKEAQMCNHMGAGAPGFTAQAIGFHKTADKIIAAAQAQDKKQVLVELSATLQTCTACHAQWKQRPVDDATFAQFGAPMGH